MANRIAVVVDSRFHRASGPLALAEMLAAVGYPGSGDVTPSMELTGVEELELAGPDQLALAASKDYLEQLRSTRAGAVIVISDLADAVPPGTLPVIAEDPHGLFVDLLGQLYPSGTRMEVQALLGPRSPEPLIEQGAHLGENVVLGPGVEIGAGTWIGPNSVIGPGVAIGRNCTIAANCTVEYAYLGSNVVLKPGARVGCEGFGWLDFGRTNRRIPQLGRVILQDGVEVGANSTIDRGALGDTVIGEGTKIDNLVQIGHNCRVGRYCLIAGMAGLAGSSILEDGVMMGAGAGTSGHLTLGAGSIVYGSSKVSKSWPANSRLFGTPARDAKEYWREAATLRRLARGESQR